MDRNILKHLFTLTIAVIWIFLFLKTFYEWTQGKQPDNFTVIVIIVLAITSEYRINYKNKNQ